MWRANRSVRQEPYHRWRAASRVRRVLVASIARLPTSQAHQEATGLDRLLHPYSAVQATCDSHSGLVHRKVIRFELQNGRLEIAVEFSDNKRRLPLSSLPVSGCTVRQSINMDRSHFFGPAFEIPRAVPRPTCGRTDPAAVSPCEWAGRFEFALGGLASHLGIGPRHGQAPGQIRDSDIQLRSAQPHRSLGHEAACAGHHSRRIQADCDQRPGHSGIGAAAEASAAGGQVRDRPHRAPPSPQPQHRDVLVDRRPSLPNRQHADQSQSRGLPEFRDPGWLAGASRRLQRPASPLRHHAAAALRQHGLHHSRSIRRLPGREIPPVRAAERPERAELQGADPRIRGGHERRAASRPRELTGPTGTQTRVSVAP